MNLDYTPLKVNEPLVYFTFFYRFFLENGRDFLILRHIFIGEVSIPQTEKKKRG